MKIGNTIIDAIGPCPYPQAFMAACEGFTIDLFNKNGTINPFSIFLASGQLLLAQWNFSNQSEKNKAMAQAKAICKTLDVTKYFSVSEVWMTAIDKDDPELNSKMKKINQTGVANEPDRVEKVVLILEAKGEKTIMVLYDIVREKKVTLANRQIMDGVDKGRMVGILE